MPCVKLSQGLDLVQILEEQNKNDFVPILFHTHPPTDQATPTPKNLGGCSIYNRPQKILAKN